jgi:DNA-binding IclR family transcriptional regulator
MVPGTRTIDRALCVLEEFTRTKRRWRTTELAHHCELPIPTTHRILRVLASFGYVTRERGSGTYVLGPSAARLAHAQPLTAELGEHGLPALHAVARATGEHASLAALAESRDHGLEVVAEAAGPRTSDPRLRPLHAGAPSKVLLAEMGTEELVELIRRGLEPVGPATITRAPRLRQEVAAVRRRGWAFSREERVPSRWAVAVPVRRPVGAAHALAISAPLDRFDRARARHHLAVLRLAASRLAERLDDRGISRGEPRWQTV